MKRLKLMKRICLSDAFRVSNQFVRRKVKSWSQVGRWFPQMTRRQADENLFQVEYTSFSSIMVTNYAEQLFHPRVCVCQQSLSIVKIK